MQNYNFNYHQYKKKIHKQNVSIIPLLLCIIIITLGVAFFLRPQKTELNKFYFVEIDSFETYKDASNLAQNIQSSGGAGYIYYNNKYRVLAGFYPYYSQAESVTNNLKSEFKNCQIFTLECKKLKNINNLSSSQNNVMNEFSKVVFKNIYKMADLSIKYDKNEIDTQNLSLSFKSINNEIDSYYQEFISNFKTNSKFNTAKSYAKNITSSLKTLQNIETEQEINRKIKYEIK